MPYPRQVLAQDLQRSPVGIIQHERLRAAPPLIVLFDRFRGAQLLLPGPFQRARHQDLALDSRDLRQRLAKIHLRMAGIVPQRHKNFAMSLPSRQHVVLNDGDPARVAVLVAKPFENPLRGVPLLSRPSFIRCQDRVDDPGKRIQLRTRWRPAPPVPGWDRKRQHLRYRPRMDPKTPRRCPLTQTLNLNRKTNLSVKLHVLHPPAPAAFRQRLSAAGFLLRPDRTTRPLQ